MTDMKNEPGYPPKWDYNAWLADPARPDPTAWMREMYGDYCRLDAYPWIADKDYRGDVLPVKSIQERRDIFDGAQGPVTRYWRVRGDGDMGLPRKSDQALHLELLMMTIATGAEGGEIEYSYHDLASSVGLKPGPRSYERIDLALSRLGKVQVTCSGSPTLPEQAGPGIDASFCIVSSIGCNVEGGEKSGSLQWNRRVLAPLWSLVETRGTSYSEGEHDSGDGQAGLKQLLIKMLTPAVP